MRIWNSLNEENYLMPQRINLPITREWPTQGEWTYEAYLALPDDGKRYEVIEGVLYATAPPNFEHQFVLSQLILYLGNYVHDTSIGYVIPARFEVHLSVNTRPLQPDLIFFKTERFPGAGANCFVGTPDLIIEVVSATTIRTDQVIKFLAYEKAGVLEYWLINPVSRLVQVFVLSGREYGLLGEFVGEDVVRSAVLEGLEIVTRTLFNPGK
jgi:Uma2 family endonuclease